MANLVDTTEMYLRTILDLEEEGIVPLRARISERLGHSGPTVSQTVARMERDGLVEVAPDRTLVLTEIGRETAVRVLRKHRIAEALLADLIGLDLSLVHEEACRWEHVMSDEAEARIFAVLGEPTHSPYGTPIPGVDALYRDAAKSFRTGVVSLADVLASVEDAATPIAVTVARLGEPIQAEAQLLAQLYDFGVVPRARLDVVANGDMVRFSASGDEALDVPAEFAAHLYVLNTAAATT